MKKFLKVFMKTVAIAASVAGIAYVIKQILDKKSEADDFEDFDSEEETSREYVSINIPSADEIKTAAKDIKDTAKEAAEDVKETVKDAAGDVKDAVKDAADDVKESVADAADDLLNK